MLDSSLSLCQLFDPNVATNPYPLYQRMREQDPVHWDPFLQAWVVMRYADVVTALHGFASRITSPSGMAADPAAEAVMREMSFPGKTAPAWWGPAAAAFSMRSVEQMRGCIEDVAAKLIDGFLSSGRVELISAFAEPFPAIVAAKLLGVPAQDYRRLQEWSAICSPMLTTHLATEWSPTMVRAVGELVMYFQAAIAQIQRHPGEGLLHSLLTAEACGEPLTGEEVIAGCLAATVSAQINAARLIGNGMLTLLQHPAEMRRLRDDPALIEPAVEELLRYESPAQHSVGLAAEDMVIGGKEVRKGQAVIAVMASANRDPERFAHPDELNLARLDNRHLAFGSGSSVRLGASLARVEAQIGLSVLLGRLAELALEPTANLVWREQVACGA